jgi:gamma-glutamyltranspeptidase/glutathione hydrolase
MLPLLGQKHEAPEAGEVFRQPDLAATLRKLVEAEQQALAQGKSRRGAIYAAYDRFYKGDIAREIARKTRALSVTLESRCSVTRWHQIRLPRHQTREQ